MYVDSRLYTPALHPLSFGSVFVTSSVFVMSSTTCLYQNHTLPADAPRSLLTHREATGLGVLTPKCKTTPKTAWKHDQQPASYTEGSSNHATTTQDDPAVIVRLLEEGPTNENLPMTAERGLDLRCGGLS